MSILRRIRRCRSGSTSIEFAIVGLSFMILSVGVMECGRGLFMRNHMAHATDMAVRKMLVNKSATDQEVAQALRDALEHGDPDLLEIELSTEIQDDEEHRRLIVRYPLSLGFPGMPAHVVTMQMERKIALAEDGWWLGQTP